MNFISSVYLWLLPLVSLPLLIYLFNRNKLKNVDFSSLIFLHKIKDDSIKKINITNILLLLIRTLIILFFIIMMARPTYNSFYKSNTNIDAIVIIGIDNSISMSNNINDNIKNTIKNTIEPFNDNTKIKIITLAKNELIYSGEKKELNLNSIRIKKTFKPINMESIKKIIDNNTTSLNTFLFIVSDGQKHLLNSPVNTSDKENFYIHYIYTNHEKENLSINQLDINKSILLPNDRFKISAAIQNNGSVDMKDKFANLIINDIHIGKHYLDIKKNSEHIIEFEASVPDYGEYLSYIKLSDDDILEDNKYYFTINIQEKINIDIIANHRNVYLDNTLNSFNMNQKIIDIEYHTLNTYLDKKIDRNILFIIGMDNITDELKKKIYASKSFPHFKMIAIPNIDDLNFNSISNFISDFNLVSSNRVIYTNNNYTEIKSTHINDYFFSKIYKDLPSRNIKIFNYIEMDSDKNTIIRLANNKSLLNRFLLNNNKLELNLLSISFNLESSNWPLKGSIIPFMQYLVIDKNLLEYTDVHKSLEKMKIEINSKITSPLGKSILFNSINQNTFLNELGFHKKTIGSDDSYFAVNLGEDELLSEYLSYDKLAEFLDKKITLSNTPKEAAKYVNTVIIGHDLWKVFLYLILILIFLEMFLTTIYIKND